MPRNNEKELYWEKCLEEWSKSGERLKPWCKRNHVSYSALWYRERKRHISTSKKMLPSIFFSELVEESTSSTSSGIEVRIGDASICLCKNFDKDTFLSCVRVLQGERR